MSTTVTLNSVSYSIPAVGDQNWGASLSAYLIALSTGLLTKAGGNFTLTADVNFGASYGLMAPYLKSTTSTIASAGVIRLAKTDAIKWRNNANAADLSLAIDGSNNLTFAGVIVGNSTTVRPPQYGGTGIANNSASTIAITGAYATTLTISDVTTLTLPTSGTVATTSNKLSAFAATSSSELAGVISDETGTGALVFANTPTLVTPVIGAATGTSLSVSGQLTSTIATGTAPLAVTSTTRVANLNAATAGTADTVTINANLTGVITSSGNATSIASQTGTGTKFVTDTSPTLVTPILGVAAATSINKMAITAPATSSTLAVADGKTATISNTLTLAGTDGNTMTFPSGSSTVMTLASTDTVTGAKTFGDAKLLLAGSSSGATTIKAAAAASTYIATLPAATDTLVGLATADTLTNKTLTTPNITGSGYINMLTQSAIRFNDDSGGEYVALQAPTGVTTHTLKLPAAQGAASTTINNDGSGNLTWVAGVSAGQNQYNTDIGNDSNIRTAVNTNLLGYIKASALSQAYTVTNAAPGVFTVTTAPATGEKAYVTVTQNGFTASTTYYVTNVSGTTFKLATTLANAVAGTNITSSGTTAGVIVSGGLSATAGVLPGIVTGTAITAGYVGEYISAACSADTTTVTSNSSVSVTGLSIALTPGIWRIGFDVAAVTQNNAAGTASTTGRVNLRDSTNSVDIANTSAGFAANLAASGSAGDSLYNSLSRSTVINISAAATYIVRVICSRTSSGGADVTVKSTAISAGITDPDNASMLWAQRIA